jgi:argininosuccinate lyase
MASDPVWQARLAAGLDPRAQRLNDSLPVDHRLWPEELALSRAWAQSVAEAGVLAPAELVALLAACDALERDLADGRATLAGEDVHSAVESELTARCGDPARRLHTGRSRNDQVATLLRLRVMQQCLEAVEGVRLLERALLAQAGAAGERRVAAYTHLQPAQPVLLAQWWLAHVAALERDEERFLATHRAADLLPLGSGAVAGTPLAHDRLGLARRLGFSRLAGNSMDAVGDRDFALEYLHAAAALGVHLSRLAEDLVLWCSPGFGWFRAPDGFSTGSSLLPQKRNPDVFELARGKAGRLLANAQRLAVVLKGLPSAYQKDLQEDKEAVFDSADTLTALLDVLPAAIAALVPDDARLAASLTPDLLAVELADALVAEGVPFREAHALVGRLWAEAEQAGVEPAALPAARRLALSPHFTDQRLSALSFEGALERRTHAPGGGPLSVAAQIARHRARLGTGDGPSADDAPPPLAARLDGSAMDHARAEGAGGMLGRGVNARGEVLVGRGASGPTPIDAPEEGPGGARGRGVNARGEVLVGRGASGPTPIDAPEEGPGGARGRGVNARGEVLVGWGASGPAAPSVPGTLPAIDQTTNPPTDPDESSVQGQRGADVVLRRATPADVHGIARLVSAHVADGTLLPRPVSELFQSVREFHVAARAGEVVGCVALRLLWDDLAEVRTLAVRDDQRGSGLGARLVARAVADARSLGLPRVIALTREARFFERCGFRVVERDTLPRKIWADCIRCPRRHACDEVGMALELAGAAVERTAGCEVAQ